MTALAHLRLYRFGSGARFGGQLLGALERMELGGDTQLLDVLFVLRAPEGGALQAVDLATGRGHGTMSRLLDFRLDPRRRDAVTERTLAEHPGGVGRAVIEGLGDTLEPGEALLASLASGGPATALGDAVAACGGVCLADEPVDAADLAAVGARLVEAAGRTTT